MLQVKKRGATASAKPVTAPFAAGATGGATGQPRRNRIPAGRPLPRLSRRAAASAWRPWPWR
eukprot:9898958-Alexandrium_andersonii.AAC.1